MKENKHIPALRFNWLTKIYNPLVAFTMPEEKFKNELIQQANINSNDFVLDFGVGTATLSILLKKKVPNVLIHGIDVDEKILNIARQKIDDSKMDIPISQYNGLKLPFPNNHFDKVITSLVFHHLDQVQKKNALNEIHRVLKSDGELHIADWGKPNNFLMRLAFYLVQFLDGFKTTNDNVRGLLPVYIKDANFNNIRISKTYNTVFGTLSLYHASKLN